MVCAADCPRMRAVDINYALTVLLHALSPPSRQSSSGNHVLRYFSHSDRYSRELPTFLQHFIQIHPFSIMKKQKKIFDKFVISFSGTAASKVHQPLTFQESIRSASFRSHKMTQQELPKENLLNVVFLGRFLLTVQKSTHGQL